MRLYEAAIIYLTIGAPIAMMYFFRNRRGTNFQLGLLTIATFIFWLPLVFYLSIKAVSSTFDKSRFAPKAGSDVDFESKLKEIKGVLVWSNDTVEFREALDRYAALTSETRFAVRLRSPGTFEIFAIAANRNEAAGTACMARKIRSKLINHQRRAALDLISSVKKIAVYGDMGVNAIARTAALALDLGDNATSALLLDVLKDRSRTGKAGNQQVETENLAAA
ncbi:MAG: hypothetical protein KIT61_16380 [Pyrinomonadaceae bacterium]|nr:hypothetical protein [Pyrinomonadaceae bacterium]